MLQRYFLQKRHFLQIFVIIAQLINFHSISAHFATCSILTSPDQHQTCVLLGDDHPSQKLDAEAQQFTNLDDFFSSHHNPLLILVEDYAANFHAFPPPKFPLLLPKLAEQLGTKYTQSQYLSWKNIDYRANANLASDFLDPNAIPAAIGLPEYVYSITFQKLFNEYDELVKTLMRQYHELSDPRTQSLLQNELCLTQAALLSLKSSLIKYFNATNSTPILQTTTELWLNALLGYFEAQQPTEQISAALAFFEDFEQKLPVFAQNYALCSPKTKHKHYFSYKTHLKELFFNSHEPVQLPIPGDRRASLRHKIMACFTPLVDLAILHEILANQEKSQILVITGFIHANHVSAHLQSLGYNITYIDPCIDDFSQTIRSINSHLE